MRLRFLRSATAAAVIAAAVLGATSATGRGATAPRAALLPLLFNEGAIQQDVDDGLIWDRKGTWETTQILHEPGRLVMSVRITPPDAGLPDNGGPAVLFARLSLFGGIGEIGWGQQAAPIVWAPLKACIGASPCTYEGRIVIPTKGLYRPVQDPRVSSFEAAVDLSLVRTFNRGALLQVLPLAPDEVTYRDSGTLGRPLPTSGPIPSFAAFPRALARPTGDLGGARLDYAAVVDQVRHDLGDSSAPLPTVTGRLDLHLDCRATVVAVRDADWNVAFYREGPARTVHADFSLLDGRDWTVMVFGAVAATFSTAGSDVLLQGNLTCGRNYGDIVGAVTATATDLPPLPPTDTGPSANQQGRPGVLLVLTTVFCCAWLVMFAKMARRLVS